MIVKNVLNTLAPAVRTSQPFILGERTFSIAYCCYFIILVFQVVQRFSRSTCHFHTTRFVRDQILVLQ